MTLKQSPVLNSNGGNMYTNWKSDIKISLMKKLAHV